MLAFSRQHTFQPEVLSLGDVLSDLTLLLGRLLGEKIDLNVINGRHLWQVKDRKSTRRDYRNPQHVTVHHLCRLPLDKQKY